MKNITRQERRTRRVAKLRAKGRRSYILIYGVLGWGLTCAVLSTALDFWIRGDPVLLHDVVFRFVLWPAMGFLWGAVTWSRMEKQWADLETDSPEE